MANAITNDVQLPLFAPPGTLVPKLIHSGTDWVGQPYIYTDQSTVALRSKTGQGILVDNEFGISMSGQLSIFESLESVHFAGGYFTINPLQLEAIGSSAAFPVPFLIPSLPRLIAAAGTVSNSVSALKAADPSMVL
jgi:hypothetical protein